MVVVEVVVEVVTKIETMTLDLQRELLVGTEVSINQDFLLRIIYLRIN